MEKVQERALRFVYEDFGSFYEDLLQKTGLPSLHIRSMRLMVIEVFKILNEMCPPVLANLVQKGQVLIISYFQTFCRFRQ